MHIPKTRTTRIEPVQADARYLHGISRKPLELIKFKELVEFRKCCCDKMFRISSRS